MVYSGARVEFSRGCGGGTGWSGWGWGVNSQPGGTSKVLLTLVPGSQQPRLESSLTCELGKCFAARGATRGEGRARGRDDGQRDDPNPNARATTGRLKNRLLNGCFETALVRVFSFGFY